jgi:hypothetical protein
MNENFRSKLGKRKPFCISHHFLGVLEKYLAAILPEAISLVNKGMELRREIAISPSAQYAIFRRLPLQSATAGRPA